MKERPIIFSEPMVKAILEGRKTQTRRLMKPQPDHNAYDEPYWFVGGFRLRKDAANPIRPRFGDVGDHLWIRETFSDPHTLDVQCKNFTGFYRACDPDRKVKWKSPIFMPRWASRITLEITDIQAQRLGDITEEDAIKEGIAKEFDDRVMADLYTCGKNVSQLGPIPAYINLWENINGVGSWDRNKWVWAITFKKLEPS